jgi:hypothetical protein
MVFTTTRAPRQDARNASPDDPQPSERSNAQLDDGTSTSQSSRAATSRRRASSLDASLDASSARSASDISGDAPRCEGKGNESSER